MTCALHSLDPGCIEREYQEVARSPPTPAADHDDPVDHFLAGVEPIGRRMIIADDAAAALDPFHVDPVRNIAGDPHQQDQHDADGEGEAQIVVGVFRPLRPGR